MADDASNIAAKFLRSNKQFKFSETTFTKSNLKSKKLNLLTSSHSSDVITSKCLYLKFSKKM